MRPQNLKFSGGTLAAQFNRQCLFILSRIVIRFELGISLGSGRTEFPFEIDRIWGCSSVGRAVALQAIGQEFESPQLHQFEISDLSFEISNGRVAQLVRACA